MQARLVFNNEDEITFTTAGGNNCPPSNAVGIPFVTKGTDQIVMDVQFEHVGAVYACLKIQGTNVYEKQTNSFV